MHKGMDAGCIMARGVHYCVQLCCVRYCVQRIFCVRYCCVLLCVLLRVLSARRICCGLCVCVCSGMDRWSALHPTFP